VQYPSLNTRQNERAPSRFSFHRRTLAAILSLLRPNVAAGEWRDYGHLFACERLLLVFDFLSQDAESYHCIPAVEKRSQVAV